MNESVRRGLVALIIGAALLVLALLASTGADSVVMPLRLAGTIAGILGVVLLCHGLLSRNPD